MKGKNNRVRYTVNHLRSYSYTTLQRINKVFRRNETPGNTTAGHKYSE